jgi:hypothetical protein
MYDLTRFILVRLALAAFSLAAAMGAGCVSNIDEEGSPCPCGPGWKCCDDVCIKKEAMCLNDAQKLLVALEGTWIGTVSEAHTMSGTNRVVLEMTLPADGEPALDGLTGDIRFGEELDKTPADPEFPRIEDGYTYLDIRDGFRFTLLNMAILEGRLLAEFETAEQWKEFCEAQTKTYSVEDELYLCLPGETSWWKEEGEGPNGEQGMIFHGPNGEEEFLSIGKCQLCENVCECDSSGCSVDIDNATHKGKLDLTVNPETGLMIGDGSEGHIEATKQ